MSMTGSEFEASNQAYLKAGLAWLRACLEGRRPPRPPELEAKSAGLWDLGRRRQPDTLLLSATHASSLIETTRSAFDAAAERQPAPALVELSTRLGLSRFETDVLLLAAALEIDPSLPDLLSAAGGTSASRAPTFALAMSLFTEPRWDAMSPHRPLRGLRMIEVHQAGATALLNAPLRIDERVGAYVKGMNYLDERLAALCSVVPAVTALPRSQQPAADALTKWLENPLAGHLLQLTGADQSSKRDVAAASAAASGRVLLAIPADTVPPPGDDAEQFVQLWSREAALLPVVLFVHGIDADRAMGDDSRNADDARRWRLLQRIGAPVLLACREALTDLEQSVVVAVESPLASERGALWHDALAADDATELPAASEQRLGAEFSLSASRIASLAAAARAMAPPGQDPSLTAWEVCVARTCGELNGLAQRIVSRTSIDDLQLPAPERTQLQRLIAHARHRTAALTDFGFGERSSRGLGIAALFHGESGAGKTMAAEAVAHALSLALFRVDLSVLMSKYIGETAKNLRRTLDAAEAGGAVMLFDEADAVFSKRSEVKDSHDRYANIDVDYLLTRMENFRGVALLATNMKHALDPAFMRRLRFIIGFPFPGAAERKAIWAGVFPRPETVGELDLDHLARFALTGGSIFNAALAAAHSAVSESAKIEMRHVLDAIRWELRKIERPVMESQFRVVTEVVAESAENVA
jgi:ATPase family associated with various cellular activities (AAA)